VSGGSPTWEEFASEVAEVLSVPAASIRRDARLVEDIDADSLAVIELVTALIGDYGLSMPNGLDPSRWQGLTAGQLFDSVRQGSLP
jgi:acyl carrier protein